MSTNFTKREREPMNHSKPIQKVPFKQQCENCQAMFWYHSPVYYCPDCEDAIFCEEEPIYGNHRDTEILEIERIRKQHYPALHNAGRFVVEYDPLPVECGGFSKGATMNKEEIEAGLRLQSLSPGMIIRYNGKGKRMYRVVCDGGYYKLVNEKRGKNA